MRHACLVVLLVLLWWNVVQAQDVPLRLTDDTPTRGPSLFADYIAGWCAGREAAAQQSQWVSDRWRVLVRLPAEPYAESIARMQAAGGPKSGTEGTIVAQTVRLMAESADYYLVLHPWTQPVTVHFGHGITFTCPVQPEGE